MFSVINELNYATEHECLIIGLYEKPEKFTGILAELDEQFNGQLTELVKSGDLSAKKKAVAKVHTFGKIGAKRLYIVGLGKEKEYSFEIVREALGNTFKAIHTAKIQEVAVYLDSFICEDVEALDAAHAVSEAFALSTYQFEGYKQKSNDDIFLKSIYA